MCACVRACVCVVVWVSGFVGVWVCCIYTAKQIPFLYRALLSVYRALSTQEASGWWVFDPEYTHLFDLYHSLKNDVLFRFIPRVSVLGSTSAGFQWTGLAPAGFQEALCGSFEFM